MRRFHKHILWFYLNDKINKIKLPITKNQLTSKTQNQTNNRFIMIVFTAKYKHTTRPFFRVIGEPLLRVPITGELSIDLKEKR